MKNKLKACIIVITTLATVISTFAFITSQNKTIIEEDNIINEVFIEVKNITFRFTSLSQKEIVGIF